MPKSDLANAPTPSWARPTDPDEVLAQRARARLTAARAAVDKDHLIELLEMLELWPSQDTEVVNRLWPKPQHTLPSIGGSIRLRQRDRGSTPEW